MMPTFRGSLLKAEAGSYGKTQNTSNWSTSVLQYHNVVALPQKSELKLTLSTEAWFRKRRRGDQQSTASEATGCHTQKQMIVN